MKKCCDKPNETFVGCKLIGGLYMNIIKCINCGEVSFVDKTKEMQERYAKKDEVSKL